MAEGVPEAEQLGSLDGELDGQSWRQKKGCLTLGIVKGVELRVMIRPELRPGG